MNSLQTISDTDRLAWAQMIQDSPEEIENNPARFAKAIAATFKIINKDSQLVDFVLNTPQRIFLKAFFKQKLAGLPVRIIILKARQLGFSSLIAAIASMLMLLRGNMGCLVAADDKGDVVDALYNIYTRFFEHYPIEDMVKNKSRGHTFRLQNDSNIRCTGEKDVKGLTCSLLHLSEAAFFTDLPKFQAMANQAIPGRDGTAIILESTANRYMDSFHRLYKESEAGENGYTALFYSWFTDNEYTMPFRDEEERDRFEKSLGNVSGHYGEELKLLEEHGDNGLTLEHLKWRRWCIDTNTNRSASEFSRQYPSTAEDAFKAKDSQVIKTEALKFYMDSEIRKPASVGRFEIRETLPKNQAPILIEVPDGVKDYVEIYDHPEPWQEFTAGADMATGLASLDYSCGVIVRRHPLAVVAKLRGFDNAHMAPSEFSAQMFMLCKYYNEAYFCPENNTIGAAVIDRFVEWDYPALMTEMQIFPDKVSVNTRTLRYGWTNTASSRAKGIAMLKEHIEEKLIRIPDKRIITEALSFVWKSVAGSDREPKAQAERKGMSRSSRTDDDQGYFDDCLFALIGALFAHKALGDVELPTSQEIEMWRNTEYAAPFQTQRDEYETGRESLDVAVDYDPRDFMGW